MAKKKEYTCVLVETDDEGITWITFNRPEKRNAMNPTLLVEMEQIVYNSNGSLCLLVADDAAYPNLGSRYHLYVDPGSAEC